jgi:hypothetical protein
VPRTDNLATFMCRLSRNSRSLNFLRPVQAFIGTALPIRFFLAKYEISYLFAVINVQFLEKKGQVMAYMKLKLVA